MMASNKISMQCNVLFCESLARMTSATAPERLESARYHNCRMVVYDCPHGRVNAARVKMVGLAAGHNP